MLHPWHYFLFRPVICSVLSAPFSLSSPLPLYLHSLARPQNTENTGNTKVSPSWKNEKHNLCVTFYKQIWLTLAELDWLCSHGSQGWPVPAVAGDFPKTVWLPDSLSVVKCQAEKIGYFHWLHLLLHHHVHFRVVVRKWELQSLSNMPTSTYSIC